LSACFCGPYDTSDKIPSTAKPETPNDVKSKLAAQMKTKEEEKKEEEKPVQGEPHNGRGFLARC
jgi:hypothetical protein